MKRCNNVLKLGSLFLQFVKLLRRRPGCFEGEFPVEVLYLFFEAADIKDNLSGPRSLT